MFVIFESNFITIVIFQFNEKPLRSQFAVPLQNLDLPCSFQIKMNENHLIAFYQKK